MQLYFDCCQNYFRLADGRWLGKWKEQLLLAVYCIHCYIIKDKAYLYRLYVHFGETNHTFTRKIRIPYNNECRSHWRKLQNHLCNPEKNGIPLEITLIFSLWWKKIAFTVSEIFNSPVVRKHTCFENILSTLIFNPRHKTRRIVTSPSTSHCGEIHTCVRLCYISSLEMPSQPLVFFSKKEQ